MFISILEKEEYFILKSCHVILSFILVYTSIIRLNTDRIDIIHKFSLFIHSFLRYPKFASVCVTSNEVVCSRKTHSDANFAYGATFKVHYVCLRDKAPIDHWV